MGPSDAAANPVPRPAGARPMWCDRFDGDLTRLVPEAREIVGDLADVVLWTAGHTTDGALNHPCVWNGDGGTFVAFFGFRGSARPSGFVASGELVQCTAWEAVRDAWPHGYVLHVERVPVWNTQWLRPELETILWTVRGIAGPSGDAEPARRRVRCSLENAMGRLRALVEAHGADVQRDPATRSAS